MAYSLVAGNSTPILPLEREALLGVFGVYPVQGSKFRNARLARKPAKTRSFTPPNGIYGSSETVGPLMWQIPLCSRLAASGAGYILSEHGR